MDIDIHPAKGTKDITLIGISGRIDSYTLERVTEEIQSLIRIGSVKLICNLSAVDFVSGVGLKAFLKAIQDSRKGGGDFKLCALQPAVDKIFRLAGFADVAEIYPSEAAALAAFGAGPAPGAGAFEQTMVPGMAPPGGGDPYGQTMIAAPGGGSGGGGFDATMIATPAGASGKGFDATMIEGGAGNGGGGFEKTFVATPAGQSGDPMAALREKLKTAAKGGKPPAGKQGDAISKLRDKLKSQADATAPAAVSAAPMDDKAFATVMTRIDEIAEKPVAKDEAAGASDTASVSPIKIVIPCELKHVEPVSHIVGAAGALSGIAKMDMVKFGVAVVEVLKAVVRHAPEADRVVCEITAETGAVKLAVQAEGNAYDFFATLRPAMESKINSPAQAREWLEKLVSELAVEEGKGAPRIVLVRLA